MIRLRQKLGEIYSPLYFLAALGSGGAVITFFMYLMFMTPHPATPIPTWESVMAVMTGTNLVLQILTGVAVTGIILFSLLHLRLLVWNINEYRYFKKTEAYQKLKSSNAEVQLMAMPLTYAMSINVGFILGALFVPKLWSVVEYLFPAALVAFGVVGAYAVFIYTHFLSRLLIKGQFDCNRNNSFSQLLAIFAFSMIAVGFSAPAAMSTVKLTSGIGIMLSLVFLSAAAVLAFIQMTLGFRAMLQHGVDRESSVSLWILIPIITVAGIALYRLSMASHHNFGTETSAIGTLSLFTILIGVQLFFALLGFVVMKKLGYFSTYISGVGKSAGSYALICPGVAFYVLSFFFVHKGLVDTGLVEKNSIAYLVLLVPLVVLQLKTLMTMFQLNHKLLRREPMVQVAVAA